MAIFDDTRDGDCTNGYGKEEVSEALMLGCFGIFERAIEASKKTTNNALLTPIENSSKVNNRAGR